MAMIFAVMCAPEVVAPYLAGRSGPYTRRDDVNDGVVVGLVEET